MSCELTAASCKCVKSSSWGLLTWSVTLFCQAVGGLLNESRSRCSGCGVATTHTHKVAATTTNIAACMHSQTLRLSSLPTIEPPGTTSRHLLLFLLTLFFLYMSILINFILYLCTLECSLYFFFVFN